MSRTFVLALVVAFIVVVLWNWVSAFLNEASPNKIRWDRHPL
jgi:hypothetical protein